MSWEDEYFDGTPNSPDPLFDSGDDIPSGSAGQTVATDAALLTGGPDEEPNLVGFAWPFKFDNGTVAQSKDNTHIRDSLIRLIMTSKYEYIMIPEYGCDIHQRIFDPVNVTSLVNRDIGIAVEQWLPNVVLKSIDADLGLSAEGIVRTNIEFDIVGSGQQSAVNPSFRSKT